MDGASNDPNSTGLTMLWNHYVFRRGKGVHELWDRMHHKRKLRLLYIAGRGFDVRAQAVMKQYVANLQAAGCEVVSAKLVLLAFTGYALEQDVQDLTEENARALEEIFSPLGPVQVVTMAASSDGEEDIGASNALRLATHEVLSHIAEQTDVVLDVSSLPRMTYLALLTGILTKLIPDRSVVAGRPHPLAANGVSFQVLAAADARLDGLIRAEDPSNELVQIPGFSGAFHAETVKDWPRVWFPILGENRVNQLTKVLTSSDVAASAEICPVVPHPSTNPRRADDLLVEYMDPLFRSRQTPTSNIVYVHESNPFEAYRQLLSAMLRYKQSLNVLGNCRLLVTPLGSKLITVGAGLACFEMKPTGIGDSHRIALPLAEPRRYIASVGSLRASAPELSALLLTGDAYA